MKEIAKNYDSTIYLYDDCICKGWREAHGFGRLISTRRRFIVIENAGDNATLNRTVEKYKEDGYEYDSQNSTDRLLVFAKHEEIKES